MSDTPVVPDVPQTLTAETVYATDSVIAGPPVSLDDYQDISGEFASQPPVEKELETDSEPDSEEEQVNDMQQHFERVTSTLLLGGIAIVSVITYLSLFGVDMQHPYVGRDYF